MAGHWVTVAASVAAYVASSDGVGVAAFHLQATTTGASFGLGSSQLSRGVGLFPLNNVPLKAAGYTTSIPSPSQLRLPALFAQGERGNLEEGDGDGSVLAMASFLRCHKPLLNDRGPEIPDGNLCMLLRGCDAHQRMISPLELKTNAEALPGAIPAGLMAAKGPAAAKALCERLKDKVASSAEECQGLRRLELLSLEVDKVHRLLQYATAAGLKKNFLNQDALQVMLELYEEAGLHSENIVKVVEGLKDFYQGEMDAVSFKEFFMPAYDEVIAKLQEAKRLVRPAEKIPVASLPFEPMPDPRTVTPLVVDIMGFKDQLPNLKAWEGKK